MCCVTRVSPRSYIPEKIIAMLMISKFFQSIDLSHHTINGNFLSKCYRRHMESILLRELYTIIYLRGGISIHEKVGGRYWKDYNETLGSQRYSYKNGVVAPIPNGCYSKGFLGVFGGSIVHPVLNQTTHVWRHYWFGEKRCFIEIFLTTIVSHLIVVSTMTIYPKQFLIIKYIEWGFFFLLFTQIWLYVKFVSYNKFIMKKNYYEGAVRWCTEKYQIKQNNKHFRPSNCIIFI